MSRQKKKNLKKGKLIFSLGLAVLILIGISAFGLSYGIIKKSSAGEKDTAYSTSEQKQREELKKAGIKEKLTMEAGSSVPDVSKFFVSENTNINAYFIKTLSETEQNEIGEHNVFISVNGKEYKTSIEVVDTIPPTATVKRGTLIFWADEVKPEDFIENMEDATEITVTFGKIDFTTEEEQEVEILLEDEAKNKTSVTAKTKLKYDKEPPEITGLYDITIYKRDTIQYRKGIEVKDNRDQEVELVIENSQVDREKEGSYPVIYTATDKAGNITKETIMVMVLESKDVEKEEVYTLADKILESILKEEMSDYDKVYAIYKWVRNNITYTGHTDPSDILAGAYQGFRYRKGDCFTYCSTAYVLYQRAGFQVMKVTRDENASELKHYWNYVNIGDGWYHCDSMLHQPDGFEPFMLTTDQMIEYTTKVMDRPDYYVYVTELYPPCGEPIRELNYTIPPKKTEPESTELPEEISAPEESSSIEETSEALTETATSEEIIWQSPSELSSAPETTQSTIQTETEATTIVPETIPETTIIVPETPISPETTVIIPETIPETAIIVPETSVQPEATAIIPE